MVGLPASGPRDSHPPRHRGVPDEPVPPKPDLRRRPGHDRDHRRALAAPPASARTGGVGGLWLLDEGSGQVANDLSFNGNRGMLGTTAGVDADDPTWVSLPRLLFLKRAALRFSGAQSVRMA